MKTIKRLSILFLATFVLASCGIDDDTAPSNPPVNPPTLSIIETAQSAQILSDLVKAVVRAELVDILNGAGPFTVLAPTNDAFAAFLATTPYSDVDEVPVDVLRNLLLNHVINGNVKATDLLTLGAGYTKTNASGPDAGSLVDVYFSANPTAGVTFNGTSNVTQADVAATNGTVHIVDNVINSTILAFATSDPNFSSLAAAATDEGQGDIATALTNANAGEPLTVFAPINTAFEAVLNSNMDWTTITDVPDAALNGILLHHVVGGNTTSDELTDGMTISMANMQNITLMIPSDQGNIATITSANGTTSEVIVVDVQATNGVVHAIDTVLLPM